MIDLCFTTWSEIGFMAPTLKVLAGPTTDGGVIGRFVEDTSTGLVEVEIWGADTGWVSGGSPKAIFNAPLVSPEEMARLGIPGEVVRGPEDMWDLFGGSTKKRLFDDLRDFFDDYMEEISNAGIYSIVGAYFLLAFVLDPNGPNNAGGVSFEGWFGIYGIAIVLAIVIVWLIRKSDIKNHTTVLERSKRLEKIEKIEHFTLAGLVAILIIFSALIYFSIE